MALAHRREAAASFSAAAVGGRAAGGKNHSRPRRAGAGRYDSVHPVLATADKARRARSFRMPAGTVAAFIGLFSRSPAAGRQAAAAVRYARTALELAADF